MGIDSESNVIVLAEHKETEAKRFIMLSIKEAIFKIMTVSEATEKMSINNWQLGNESHIQNILTLLGVEEVKVGDQIFHAREINLDGIHAKKELEGMVNSFEFLTGVKLLEKSEARELFDQIKDKEYED